MDGLNEANVSNFVVTVIGLGRIGLPHALVSAKRGNLVYGVDINSKIIEKLKNLEAPFFEPGLDNLITKYVNVNFFPSEKLTENIIDKTKIIVICVGSIAHFVNGTYHINHKPLFTVIDSLLDDNYNLEGKLLILRTTIPIGTTDMMKLYIEQKTGLVEGKDFFLAFAPERLVEGRALEEEETIPKIYGTYSDKGSEIIENYLKSIGGEVIRVKNPKTAEFMKLAENSYRQLLFAFSNDLALLAEHLNIDILEVINAANTKYPRNNIPLPSYGVSGYCLTKDPIILNQSFKPISDSRNFDSIWSYGRKVNDFTIEHAVRIITSLLEEHKPLKSNSKYTIGVLGLSYKADVDDFRLSHGVEILKSLMTKKEMIRKIVYHDPHLSKYKQNGKNGINPYLNLSLSNDGNNAMVVLEEVDDVHSLASQCDGMIITVAHSEFKKLNTAENIEKILTLMKKPPIIVDGWNVLNKLYQHDFRIHLENKVQSKVVYWGVGRGCI